MSEKDGGPLFGPESEDALPALVRRIRDAHRRCEQAIRKSVALAADLGQLLREAKGRVKHGEWVAWVREHCPFSLRMAQCYMRVAERLPGPKAQRVALLPLRQALAALAQPQTDDEERKAVLADLNAPAVKELVGAMGEQDIDSHIRTAAETGWAGNSYFLDKLTPEEQATFAALPVGQWNRPLTAEMVARILPGAEAEVRPVKRVGRRWRVKAKALPPVVLLETDGGEVVAADANQFRLLRRRHKRATVAYEPRRGLIVFQGEAGVDAVLMPRPLGIDSAPVDALHSHAAAIRAKIDQLETADHGDAIRAAQVAVRLAKLAAELDAICATPAKAGNEDSDQPTQARN